MKLYLKNLGPISKAELELGDITVLLGPPNTGKSYTLKSIYGSLMILDPFTKNLLFENFPYNLVPVELISIFGFLLPVVYCHIRKKKEISEKFSFLKKLNFEVKDSIVVTCLETEQLLSIKDFNDLLENLCEFYKILPFTKNTKIFLKPSLSHVLPSILETALKDLKIEREIEKSFEEFKLFLNYKVLLQFQKKTKAIKIQTIVNTQLSNESSLCRRENVKNAIENWFNHYTKEEFYEIFFSKRKPGPIFPGLPQPVIDALISFYLEVKKIIHQVIDQFLDKLWETFGSAGSLGFYTSLFIPFGRTPFVYQIEVMAKEPTLWNTLKYTYEPDVIFQTYMVKLSKGRRQLLQGDYQKELLQIFEPLLQGTLIPDERTKEIKYKNWREKEVPLKWASALAGEVTGILLPILTVKNPTMLIIEEPESQLHYSAHILMALTLVALSEFCNHKIVFSTHSDILALALAYIKIYKPDQRKVETLIKNLLTLQNFRRKRKDIELLAKVVSNTKVDIKFYYYEPSSKGTKVIEKSPSEIIDEVPGITKVIDIFTTWSLSL